MNAVLLLLTPESRPNRALDRAIQRAKEQQAVLLAVVVLPGRHLDELAEQLIDRGFVGEKLSEEVIEHVRQEQHAVAEEILASVREKAEREGVVVETQVIEGELPEACEAAQARFSSVHTVLPVPARAWFERLWRRAEEPSWAEDLGCRVEAVEE
jgi:nucleotide-binding universal stress UspA family protein